MHKNPYFRLVLRRRSAIADAFTSFFIFFASYPRLLLEVFIRRKFGDRYFSLTSALTVVAFFFFFPYLISFAYVPAYRYDQIELFGFAKAFPSIYIFLGLFLVVSIWHYIDIKRGPSVFNFEKFSLYGGEPNPLFWKIRIGGKVPTPRLIETVYEPLLFLIIGWILIKMDIAVGYIIFTASIFYSFSYVAAYKMGDDFIKDKIDEMICNEDMEEAFVENVTSRRGFQFRGEKPDSREQRSTLADEFIDYEDVPAQAL
jgi:hypothetical protein